MDSSIPPASTIRLAVKITARSWQALQKSIPPRVEWCPEPVEGQLNRTGNDSPLNCSFAGRLLKATGSRRMICRANDSFYVGSAQDLESRVKAHHDGRGAAYTFKHRPVNLVYSETFDSETQAVKRERQLKRWSHEKKQALVDGDLRRLKSLSKRHS
jgi:putative endonuclease